MHFFLLGATGRTGQHVVSELLANGHTAVALVRGPDKLAPRDGLTIVAGSVLSKSDVQSALTAAPELKPAAVLVTLNSSRKSGGPTPDDPSQHFLPTACATLCAVLEEKGQTNRVVIMSTAGVGDSWDNLPLLSKAFMKWSAVKYALADHEQVDKQTRTTGLDFTLVRAVRLVFDDPKQDEPTTKAKDVQTLGSSGVGMGLMDSVSVASAGRFMVKAAVEGLFVKEAVVIRDP